MFFKALLFGMALAWSQPYYIDIVSVKDKNESLVIYEKGDCKVAVSVKNTELDQTDRIWAALERKVTRRCGGFLGTRGQARKANY